MRLTEGELKRIEKRENVRLDQGTSKPLFIFGRRYEDKDRKGKKYLFLEIDTGSDRTLISTKLALRIGLKTEKFREPKVIMGVGGKKVKCERYGILKLELKTIKGSWVEIVMLCYVLDGVPPLLGNDVMSKLKCSISFKFDLLTFDDNIIELHTDKSKLNDMVEIWEKKVPCEVNFYLRDECRLGGGVAEVVNVTMTEVDLPKSAHVLIGSRSDVCVVDTSYEDKVKDYKSVLYNMGNKPITIKKGAKLGFVLVNSENTGIYGAKELLDWENSFKVKEEGTKDREEDKKGKTVQRVEGEIGGVEVQKKGDHGGEEDKGKPLTGFPDRRKLSATQLDRFFENGVDLDISGEKGKLISVELPEPVINEAEELKRNRDDIKWKDKDEFLSYFNWDKMMKEISEKEGKDMGGKIVEGLKEIYWDFKANFWDYKWANWTEANFPEMVIELIDEKATAIDKFRRMSADKEKLLRRYVSELLEADIIEKSPNGLSDGFVANPHVIIQKKVNDKGEEVIKERFIVDYRQSNSLCKSLTCRMKIGEEILAEAS